MCTDTEHSKLVNRRKKCYVVLRLTLGKIRNQALARGEGELCVLFLGRLLLLAVESHE